MATERCPHQKVSLRASRPRLKEHVIIVVDDDDDYTNTDGNTADTANTLRAMPTPTMPSPTMPTPRRTVRFDESLNQVHTMEVGQERVIFSTEVATMQRRARYLGISLRDAMENLPRE